MPFDNSKTGKVTGLWKKDTKTGKTYSTGTITGAQLQEAVKTTGVLGTQESRVSPEDAKVTLKAWVNSDKFGENSPDMNLTLEPPYTPDDDVPC